MVTGARADSWKSPQSQSGSASIHSLRGETQPLIVNCWDSCSGLIPMTSNSSLPALSLTLYNWDSWASSSVLLSSVMPVSASNSGAAAFRASTHGWLIRASLTVPPGELTVPPGESDAVSPEPESVPASPPQPPSTTAATTAVSAPNVRTNERFPISSPSFRSWIPDCPSGAPQGALLRHGRTRKAHAPLSFQGAFHERSRTAR